jgi:outer membrane receptor protein involved in Fe transport
MKNSILKSALRGHSCLFSVALLAVSASPALADEAAAETASATAAQSASASADDDNASDKAVIVVTGSRIAKPNLESAVPITSIGGDAFASEGRSSVGDALNDLPQLRSTFAQSNPGLGIGIAGLSLLDLRGLGTARTLVLVNGRRHVASDVLNNAVSLDVNTIPNDLIDRVDIVTGGNSAVYGSDALAGVVNFVLKRNYDGFQVRANGAMAGAGYAKNYYLSAMWGKNFADGRGNILLHADYTRQNRVFASEVPWLKQNDNFGVADVDVGGLTSNSDGVADNAFFRDFRSTTINRYGLIPITQRLGTLGGPAPACGQGYVPTNGPAATQNASNPAATQVGVSFNCTYLFTPEGNLVAQTGTRFGTGINSSILGGNGQTGREDKLLSVIPLIKRYNFNLVGRYEFAPALELFVEAKFNRTRARGSAAAPSFIQGTLGQFDTRERPRLDNPYLTTAQRDQIAGLILASGCNTSLTVTCGAAGNLTAAQIAQINAGTYRFVVARNLADVEIRDEDFTRDTYRFVRNFRELRKIQRKNIDSWLCRQAAFCLGNGCRTQSHDRSD